jgi:hypothetical protein
MESVTCNKGSSYIYMSCLESAGWVMREEYVTNPQVMMVMS